MDALERPIAPLAPAATDLATALSAMSVDIDDTAEQPDLADELEMDDEDDMEVENEMAALAAEEFKSGGAASNGYQNCLNTWDIACASMRCHNRPRQQADILLTFQKVAAWILCNKTWRNLNTLHSAMNHYFMSEGVSTESPFTHPRIKKLKLMYRRRRHKRDMAEGRGNDPTRTWVSPDAVEVLLTTAIEVLADQTRRRAGWQGAILVPDAVRTLLPDIQSYAVQSVELAQNDFVLKAAIELLATIEIVRASTLGAMQEGDIWFDDEGMHLKIRFLKGYEAHDARLRNMFKLIPWGPTDEPCHPRNMVFKVIKSALGLEGLQCHSIYEVLGPPEEGVAAKDLSKVMLETIHQDEFDAQGVKGTKITSHSFRKTGASAMLASGVKPERILKEGLWSHVKYVFLYADKEYPKSDFMRALFDWLM